MKIKTIILTLLVVSLGGMIAYRITKNNAESDKGKDKKDKKSPVSVEVLVLTPQDFSNSLSLSGSIEANEQVEIRSEVAGIVEKILFEEGNTVSKGQVLFKVNDVELRAQVSQAKTKEALASENERRAKLLLQKEAISQEEYDIASAEYRTAKAQTQLIQAQIAKTTVRAPFSGTIGLRSISPGTYVTASTLIAKLVATNPLKLTFALPEKYASSIVPNSEISFTVPNNTEPFKAKIYALEPEIETTTRTLKIKALTNNTSGKLIPGTFATITLPLTHVKNAIVVPSQVIVPVQNGKKVYLASHGMAREVMVETTTRTEKSVVVLSGLKAGDSLITTGVMSLKDEAPIKVIQKK